MLKTQSVELGLLKGWKISCVSNNKNAVVQYMAIKDKGGQNMPQMICDTSLKDLKAKICKMGR